MTIREALGDARTIAATSRDDFTAALTKCATDAVANYGGDEDKGRDRTIAKICDSLYAKYGGLTVMEVEYVMDEGTKGGYGDNFSITVKNVLKWLQIYLLSDERAAEKRKWDREHRNMRLDFDGTIAKKNAESIWTLLSRYYGQVNGGGHCGGIPYNLARVYDFLRDRGLRLADTKPEERNIMLAALDDARKPAKPDMWNGWAAFDETTRAKALCLDMLIRRNLQAVYDIIMHR